jgi:ADP-heptose:LPS heptosyltransferase
LIALREPGLPQLAGALALGRAWLGNDSGLSHLAAALGVPALVLFDPAKLAWRPWSATARIRAVHLGGVAAPEVNAAEVSASDVDAADVDAVQADLETLLG